MLGRLRQWLGRWVLKGTSRAADLRLDGEARLVLPPRFQGPNPQNMRAGSNVVPLEAILARRAELRLERPGARRIQGPRSKF